MQRALLSATFSNDKLGAATAIQISYWLAPAEKWVIYQRIIFFAAAMEAEDPAFAIGFQADLKRIAEKFTGDEVASVYVDAGPRVRRALAREISYLPPGRQKKIISVIDRLGEQFIE